jgi:sulfatase maturation enzyme AslB (radical SAM superfamily)
VATVEQQVARELVMKNRRHVPGAAALEERIVRVNFHCNQACRFCFVSTHLPAAAEDAVSRAIEEAGAAGARITLSGGEPTLNPRLVEHVRLAKRVSRHPIELQTNAVLLDDAERVRDLEQAGVDEVFVSLHGASAAVSDAVTAAPGTFVRTLAGLDNLAASSMKLIINFVICRANQLELVPFVQLVAARWPRALVNVSFVAASTDVVPRDESLVPRYTEVIPALDAAISEAELSGVQIGGFQAMCGLPLCLVPERARPRVTDVIPEGFDGGEFVKADACQRCDLRATCYGIRRSYVELYGSGELEPVVSG